MKYDREVTEIVQVWAENVRDDIEELKNHLAFCESDYKMYATLVKDQYALHCSPQYVRWLDSLDEYTKKYKQHKQNVEKVLKDYPEFAILFKGLF